jgi:hypothetical protein
MLPTTSCAYYLCVLEKLHNNQKVKMARSMKKAPPTESTNQRRARPQPNSFKTKQSRRANTQKICKIKYKIRRMNLKTVVE